MQTDLLTLGRQAKAAARRLAGLGTNLKNEALLAMAGALLARQEEILRANEEDLRAARENGLSGYILDRLSLTPQRLAAIAGDVRNVAALPDPVGQGFEERRLPNGLIAGKVRVPLGVIACIYEARPNVTVDVAALCLKAGNASILRGGKEALASNTALARIIAGAAEEAGIPAGAIQFIDDPDRSLVARLLAMREYIDLAVPRGGGLIDFVLEQARVPVLIGGVGVCHTYVDRAADLDKAIEIVHNAKTRRYTICNALDTLLVHCEIAPEFLPRLGRRWAEAGVEMRCDPRALAILRAASLEGLALRPAEPGDYGREHLALIATIKITDSLGEAIDHIAAYATGHSEAIVTEDYSAARRFVQEVDSAVVYVNASTQFTDGAQFGLGAEIIDSTQKLHARGPVGLQEITTYKWVVQGTGQMRQP